MSYSTIYQLNSTVKELIEQLGWNILSQIIHPNDKQIELYLIAAFYAYYQNRNAWIPLAIDVIIGLILFIQKRF